MRGAMGEEADLQGLATGDIADALARILPTCLHRSVRVVGIDHRPSPYSTTFALHEVDATLDDGSNLELVVKDMSRAAMLPIARQTRPRFLHNPHREVAIYRVLAPYGDLHLARYWGDIVDPRSGRCWLFLERVGGLALRHTGEFACWLDAARWLARFHGRFAGREAVDVAGRVPLVRYDARYYQHWADRAVARIERSTGSTIDQRFASWLQKRYAAVVESLLSLPLSVVHGDYYAANILVRSDDGSHHICPVDWELAGLGPGLVDLAALTAGGWTAEQRRALVHAYWEALPQDQAWFPSVQTLEHALAYCRLHVAVQWLGWSDAWTPPPDQAQDWLGEAKRIAEHIDRSVWSRSAVKAWGDHGM